MRTLRLIVLLFVFVCAAATAQDANLLRPTADLEARLQAMPFEILAAEKARGLREDVALKSEVRFEDGVEMRIKIRPASLGGSEFNNEPRYEMAAYLLQKAFLDDPDYVVPPTALRTLHRAKIEPYIPPIFATFRGTSDVLVVAQYWLQHVTGPRDIWDPGRFASDPTYARHIANMNVLTYLIKHGDSNPGNVLLSTDRATGRAFSVDNGISFSSKPSDRGELWRELRVPRVPARTIERLRALNLERLDALLGSVGTWEMRDGRLVPAPGHARLPGSRGVRRAKGFVQFGLTTRELRDLDKRRIQLLRLVDQGKLGTF